MHPEISDLITPSIYSKLINDPSVKLYPEVSGVAHRMVFITHTKPEDGEHVDQDDDSGISLQKILVSIITLSSIHFISRRAFFVEDLNQI